MLSAGASALVFALRAGRLAAVFLPTTFLGARAVDFFAVALPAAFLAAGFFAAVLVVAFLAAGFFAAVVFLAAAFLATGFFAAVFLVAVAFFAAGLRAVVFLAVAFFAAGFLVAVAFFAAGLRAAVFFAAGFLAAVFFGAAFLAVVFFAAAFLAGAFAAFLAVVFLAGARFAVFFLGAAFLGAAPPSPSATAAAGEMLARLRALRFLGLATAIKSFLHQFRRRSKFLWNYWNLLGSEFSQEFLLVPPLLVRACGYSRLITPHKNRLLPVPINCKATHECDRVTHEPLGTDLCDLPSSRKPLFITFTTDSSQIENVNLIANLL